MPKNKQVQFQSLGKLSYRDAWAKQSALFEGVVSMKLGNRKKEDIGEEALPTQNYLLFCEHPAVYTLGKSGKESHLLLTQEGLAAKNIEYYPIDRGGDITFHGPGQLVGYPIFDLDNFFTDIHKYLRLLEEAVILTLADFGIEAGRIEKLTGVWIDHVERKNPRKICAMGVKASRWVTMHGFALNVTTDLSYFSYIIPCGIADKDVTSMERELGYAPDIKLVEARMKQHLAELFEIVYI